MGPEFLIAAAVASMLASAGGTAMSMSAQNSIKKKQNAARMAEAARQRDIDKRRDAEMQQAQPEFEREKQDERRTSIADSIQQYLQPTVNPATEYLAGSTTPQVIKDSMNQQLVGALRKGQDYAKNLAGVSALSRQRLDNNIGLNRLGERVGMLNNESARSTGLFGGEMDASHLAGAGANSAANLLDGLGGIAGAIGSYHLMSKGLGGISGTKAAKGIATPINMSVG